ncbi:GntR family transcriptional regulator [Aliiroseovarius crassostreae]|uniref:GntR family transcriptional regulator n=1 Tax=Aliiroseovarius crassostreae TaxID=154981 RepID=UPI00220FC768|nr:GntR family transcriptional regulator [Aliiroseovarius crassostreae]UWQ00336.1 GntR family transcriptional regulator [Aliiroseovarius crassostreae]
MSRLTGRRPVHETYYTKIKEMILFGEVLPGQPLTIHGLAEAIGAGVTPVREAIRKLTTEGALEVLENRRVAVPVMTKERFEQIEILRLSVEPKLAEMGAKRLDKNGIDGLEEIDDAMGEAIDLGDIRGYLETNYRFHFALYAPSNADILLRHAEMLWLQIGPSLRVGCGRFGTSGQSDQHMEAIRALRAKDPTAVGAAMAEDIRQGMGFVQKSLTA